MGRKVYYQKLLWKSLRLIFLLLNANGPAQQALRLPSSCLDPWHHHLRATVKGIKYDTSVRASFHKLEQGP